MVFYIDESGSINNQFLNNKYFVIALLRPLDKKALKRSYKRFVSGHYDELQELDKEKYHKKTGKLIKEGGKMFLNGHFKELKGSQFDKKMKQTFVDFFCRKPSFELYYIKISNLDLSDRFCQNTARVFNYTLRLALEYFINKGLVPNEDCTLQLDERNEKTKTRFFLENYLNTELSMNGTSTGSFNVTYYDSADNDFIQIADVFSNLYYSHLQTSGYTNELRKLADAGILKFVFSFPLKN